MNVIYVTDGSLEGLLSAVYDSWYRREDAVLNIVPGMPTQPDFLITYKPIKTNEAKAEKVFDAILDKITEDAARRVMLCWFSEQPDAGRLILNYLRFGFAHGPSTEEMVSNQYVKPLHDACRRVGCEAHRLMGLARFHRTKQDFYCSIVEPQYYVLPLLAEHFADRMPDTKWLIYDKRRELSAAHEAGCWSIVPGRLIDTMKLHEDEEKYQQLWKRYFDALAIENRLNPDLQRHNMPKRYWKHLVETPGGALANHLMK